MRCCIISQDRKNGRLFLTHIVKEKGNETAYYSPDKEKAMIFEKKPDAVQMTENHPVLRFAEVEKL